MNAFCFPLSPSTLARIKGGFLENHASRITLPRASKRVRVETFLTVKFNIKVKHEQ